ncbi:hypothetical protein U0070_001417 [Myodes glareolus]|uniref:Uncharacterized protein n=1 Tax=Myodes glareolus TaxID=447135 RepID=A0AAW0IHE2_MYOGA
MLQLEEEDQEQLKAAEARRLAEPPEQVPQMAEQERRRAQECYREQECLQAKREMQEREKALQLQKDPFQRDLEEE